MGTAVTKPFHDLPSWLNGRALALFVKLYIIIMEEVLSTKAKGNLTELQCITAFYELGYQVSIPYGENSRYDFIADIEGKLIRVQVKTSSLRKDTEGAIKFATRSTRINATQNISHSYTKNEIDYFATYWEGQCYLVPISETASTEKTLRFLPPKSGQVKGIKFATEYELAKQIQKIIEE